MPTDLVEVDAFADPVTVPEPGDDRTAASIVPAFQTLTDRSRNLKNLLTGLGAVDIEIASGTAIVMKGIVGIQYDVLKTRTIPIELDSVHYNTFAGGWTSTALDPGVNPIPGGLSGGAGGYGRWSWRLPHGALLKHVRVAVFNPMVSPGPITLEVWHRRNALSAPWTPVATMLATATASTSGSYELDADCTALAVPVDGYRDVFFATMQCGANGQWIQSMNMEFGDPGPRNF